MEKLKRIKSLLFSYNFWTILVVTATVLIVFISIFRLISGEAKIPKEALINPDYGLPQKD